MEFREYFAYNILCGCIVFNDSRGYGVLEHLMGCLGAYALRYYYKLEVVYNKYYLKHRATINHKPIFAMAIKDPILNTIEKRVKEDSMETCPLGLGPFRLMWYNLKDFHLEGCLQQFDLL
jgi:hypothetical protein